MEIAVFIQNIQEERAEVALHIFSNQSRALTERFQMTDRALEEVPTWPNVRSKKTVTVLMNKDANMCLTFHLFHLRDFLVDFTVNISFISFHACYISV